MRNSWKKTAAFVLAFTLVAAPLTQTAGKGGLLGSSGIVAHAEEIYTTGSVDSSSLQVGDIVKKGVTINLTEDKGIQDVQWDGQTSVYARQYNNTTISFDYDVLVIDDSAEFLNITVANVKRYETISSENITAKSDTVPVAASYKPSVQFKAYPYEEIPDYYITHDLTEDSDYVITSIKNSENQEITNVTSAGTYTVTIEGRGCLNGTATFTWTLNVETTTLTADNITIDAFTYDGTEKTPVLKYGETALVKGTDYALDPTEGDTASATNAGTYTIHVSGMGNYTGENVLLMWNISKADPTVTAPTVKTGLTYTGSAQALAEAGTTTGGTLMYGVQVAPTVYKADGEAIDVNVADLNVGDVLQVTRDNSSKINFIGGTVKYRDSEGKLQSKNIDYINYGYWSSIPPYHFIDLYYSGGGDMLNNVEYNALIVTSKADDTITIEPYNYNASEMTTAWSDTVPEATDAGIYQLMYRVVGDNNYNSFSDVSGRLFGASEIAKADVSVTGAELTYNGEPQNLISGDVPEGTLFTLTAPNAGLDFEAEKTKINGWISALYDKASNASSSEESQYYDDAYMALDDYYLALLYLNDKYETDATEIMYEAVSNAGKMAQYDVTPTDDVKEAIDYINTYVKDKTIDDLKARFVTVEPVWSDIITATDAGKYTVYYKGSGNYDDTVKSVTATIQRAYPDVKSPVLTAKYGQTLADVKLPTVENGTWAWFTPKTTSVGDVGYNSFDASFFPIDQKNYTPIYHYSLTVNVTAIPANPAAVDALTAKYGQTLADVELPTVEDGSGSWAWKDAATTPVGNAGEHTFTAVFTPASKNYTAVEQEVTINVAKADPTLTDTSGLSATYGATLADVKLPTGWAWDAPETSVGNVGEQSFAATFTPADTDNYNVVKQNLTVNVVAVDKAALNEAVIAADTYLATISENTNYADPVKALSSAITDAKAVAENDNVTEEQVAQAITAVNNAVTTAKAAVKEIDDTLAAKAVTDMINAIPAAEDIRSSDKEAVDAARAAYTNLKEAQKAKVEKASTDKLAAAEKAVADHIAADAVIEKINAIGTVALTDESKALIDAARAAYDALMTEAQKSFVSNYPTLTSAEEEYLYLYLLVSDVEAKINAIGKIELTDAVKAKIGTARTAYDALTADQQKLVKNAVALGYAEELYTALEEKSAAETDKAKAEAEAEAQKKAAEEALAKAEKEAAEKVAAAQAAQKAAEDAQATAEQTAKEAAEKAAAAETAQKEAEEALAKGEKEAAAKVAAAQAAQKTAEAAQATAEKAATEAKAAQTKAEEEAAAAKTAQANAQKAQAAAETAQKAAEEALAKAEKEAAEKVTAAQAAQKAAEDAQATAEQTAKEAAEKAAAAETAQKEAEEALAKVEKDAAAKVAAAETAKKAAEEAQSVAEQTAKEAVEAQSAAEALAKQAEAEKEAAEKKAAEEKAAADKAAADKVIEKINEIGKVNNSNASENKIIAARAAYDTLTDEQKDLVTNYDVLTKAESAYDTLPQTGMSGLHKVFAGMAALMGITGVGLVKKSRKEDEE